MCQCYHTYNCTTFSPIALVCESPMTVQLHFEPGGRPGADREYYLRDKENICTVCGSSQNCVRKNIIPHEYRKCVCVVCVCVCVCGVCVCGVCVYSPCCLATFDGL